MWIWTFVPVLYIVTPNFYLVCSLTPSCTTCYYISCFILFVIHWHLSAYVPPSLLVRNTPGIFCNIMATAALSIGACPEHAAFPTQSRVRNCLLFYGNMRPSKTASFKSRFSSTLINELYRSYMH